MDDEYMIISLHILNKSAGLQHFNRLIHSGIQKNNLCMSGFCRKQKQICHW